MEKIPKIKLFLSNKKRKKHEESTDWVKVIIIEEKRMKNHLAFSSLYKKTNEKLHKEEIAYKETT